MITIRPAELKDLDQVIALEEEEFGPIGENAAASREIMKQRIILLNTNVEKEWFWVAESHGKVVGDIVMQPTHMSPDECRSWAHATDNGTLKETFDPKGKNIYIVSLVASADAPFGVADMVMHASVARWAMHGGRYFFASRMPGFLRAHKKTGVEAEEYWKLKRPSDGGPRDQMLRLYWVMSGKVEPVRLLKDGFPPDVDSGGHAVLFVLTNPRRALFATAKQVYVSGIAEGRRTTINKRGGGS